MTRFVIFSALLLILVACDTSRVYDINRDFENGQWLISDTAVFEFSIKDTTTAYNVILNVRNSIDFETARLFLNYSLLDSTSSPLRRRLIEQNLFHKKTGQPFGDSGLGNIYQHHITPEPNITFPAKGRYIVKLSHMMRTDTLQEILSVGVRVEKVGQ